MSMIYKGLAKHLLRLVGLSNVYLQHRLCVKRLFLFLSKIASQLHSEWHLEFPLPFTGHETFSSLPAFIYLAGIDLIGYNYYKG